jgi:hypothetical protein
MHLFAVFSAASYVLLFSIAGIISPYYIYTIVPFLAFSLTSLLEEGVQRIRSGNRRLGLVSVLASLVLIALVTIPSPLFFKYDGWRVAGELLDSSLQGIRELAESLPADVAIVVINTPFTYRQSRSELVATRSASILYPKTVRTWARANGIEREIVIFGASQFEGEVTIPKMDFRAQEGLVRIYFERQGSEYIATNDPHVRWLRMIPQGCELTWPPQNLESERFEVYVFDGRDLVPLDEVE